jgi:hypothetical protein
VGMSAKTEPAAMRRGRRLRFCGLRTIGSVERGGVLYCFRVCSVVELGGMEWNLLGAILAFGSGIGWNGTVPRKGIFRPDAERTRPGKSAGRGGMSRSAC